ncbi:MAG: hypothetical protein ACOCZX_03200 [Candidatus Bipolaricaulota bacterium]
MISDLTKKYLLPQAKTSQQVKEYKLFHPPDCDNQSLFVKRFVGQFIPKPGWSEVGKNCVYPGPIGRGITLDSCPGNHIFVLGENRKFATAALKN